MYLFLPRHYSATHYSSVFNLGASPRCTHTTRQPVRNSVILRLRSRKLGNPRNDSFWGHHFLWTLTGRAPTSLEPDPRSPWSGTSTSAKLGYFARLWSRSKTSGRDRSALVSQNHFDSFFYCYYHITVYNLVKSDESRRNAEESVRPSIFSHCWDHEVIDDANQGAVIT